MNTVLTQGTKIKSIASLPQGEYGEAVYYKAWPDNETTEPINYYHVKSITVQMEYGQGSMIPWFRVVDRVGVVSLVNSLYMSEVVLLEPDTTHD